jgi:hypothetical protein
MANDLRKAGTEYSLTTRSVIEPRSLRKFARHESVHPITTSPMK